MSECLSKILDERPGNVLGEKKKDRASIDIFPLESFEEISRFAKREKLEPRPDALQDDHTLSGRAEVAIVQQPLFMVRGGGGRPTGV